MKTQVKQLSIRISDDESTLLRRVANAFGVSVPTYTRYVLGNALTQHANVVSTQDAATVASIGVAIEQRMVEREADREARHQAKLRRARHRR